MEKKSSRWQLVLLILLILVVVGLRMYRKMSAKQQANEAQKEQADQILQHQQAREKEEAEKLMQQEQAIKDSQRNAELDELRRKREEMQDLIKTLDQEEAQ